VTSPVVSSATEPAPPETPGALAASRTTVRCTFRNLVGLALQPDVRRVEILETDQDFAGDTGLAPTGRGNTVAALTPTGLTAGERCRTVAPPKEVRAAPSFVSPYPEKYPTWLRCGIYGSVLIDVMPHDDGYRLTIGGPPHATVRAVLMPDRSGYIAFSDPTCRRFVVTDNPIP
jgi:hypothetical protein